MAILKIARMGHPILRQPAEPVADPTAPEVARLVADMLKTMVDDGGVGLAAPQVHVARRIVIFHVPRGRAGDPQAPSGSPSGPVDLTVLVNPQIEVLDGTMDAAWEACLSVPGLTGLVPRYRAIRYRGVDPRGQPVERVAEGFHARVVQHECDHLDGILYPQRMTDMRGFGFVDEVRRYPPQAAQGTTPADGSGAAQGEGS